MSKPSLQPSPGATEFTCRKCNTCKPISEYYRRKQGGIHLKCKTCWKQGIVAARERSKAADPDGFYLRNFSQSVKHRFNLTLDQYRALLESQDFKCAICSEPPPRGQRLHIDHNHETNEIRGLLCGPCNRVLGWFERFSSGQISAYLNREHTGLFVGRGTLRSMERNDKIRAARVALLDEEDASHPVRVGPAPRYCSDCSLSIDDRPARSHRCLVCQTATNQRISRQSAFRSNEAKRAAKREARRPVT